MMDQIMDVLNRVGVLGYIQLAAAVTVAIWLYHRFTNN